MYFLYFFFTRILPKIWATQHNLRFAHDWSIVAEGLHAILKNGSTWLIRLADQTARTLGATRKHEIRLQELDETITIESNEDSSPEEKKYFKGRNQVWQYCGQADYAQSLRCEWSRMGYFVSAID